MLIREIILEAKQTQLKHGSTRGHMGEYLLGSALVAKMIKGEDGVSAADVKAVMDQTSATSSLTSKFPGTEGDEIFFKNVIKNEKNIRDARDVDALVDAMSEELEGAVKFANSDIYSRKWSKIFSQNGRPDKILVKAAGEEDQKGTKADIFLIYILPNGKERIIKGWSLKTDSNLIGQASPRTFENMQVFFNLMGITLDPIENYEQDPAGHVVNIMKQVENDINKLTVGDDTDKEVKLIETITGFMADQLTKNDPRVYIVNLGRGDYTAQTISKMRRNLDKVDLEATLSLSGRPSLYVHEKGNMKDFLFMIRYSYNEPKTRPDGTTRPERHKLIVEKGPLFKRLATISADDVDKEMADPSVI